MFVGLTGGMGCGKSVVGEIFAEFGWLTLNADDICHSLYDFSNEEFTERLLDRWGYKVLGKDGSGFDRSAIAAIIFNSPEERKWLDSIIHPSVLQKSLEIRFDNPNRDILFEVPLLFEASWEDRFDAVISVWSLGTVRKRRLIARGMTEMEIRKRDLAQMPAKRKIELSDFAVINNCDFDVLKTQCEILSRTLRNNIRASDVT